MPATSTIRIAWRNLGRNRKRSLLVLGAIAVGQFTFLAVAGLMRGYIDDFYGSITGPMVGHIQVHVPEWREERSIDLALEEIDEKLAAIRSDPDVVNAAARIYAPALVALTEDGFTGMVVGIDPEAEGHESGLLPDASTAGAMGGGAALVGSGFARKHGIEPGMELAVVGQDVYGSIASALFDVSEVAWFPVDALNNMGIVASLEDAQDMLAMYGQAHEIVVHVTGRDAIPRVLERMRAMPALEGTEVLRWEDVVPEIVSMVGMIDGFLIIVLCIVFVAAAAGIANTMLMSTFERTHEFGMLLSLGCGPGRLARIITVEAVVLGLLGVAAGTALGVVFVWITSNTGLNYAALGGNDGSSYEVAFKGLQMSSIAYPRLYAKDVVASVAAVFLTSLVSVGWPIFRIIRLEPVEAMRT